MTTEQLSMFVAVGISLACSYVPGLNTRWAVLQSDTKRLVMLILLAVATIISFGLACAGVLTDLGINVTCDKLGAISLVITFLQALIANQGAYMLSPEAKAVTRAKELQSYGLQSTHAG